jgi:hypothetical protein
LISARIFSVCQGTEKGSSRCILGDLGCVAVERKQRRRMMPRQQIPTVYFLSSIISDVDFDRILGGVGEVSPLYSRAHRLGQNPQGFETSL